MTATQSTPVQAAAVTFDITGQIATITLSNPRRKNAIPQSGWSALKEALEEANASDVRAVVLTGEGEDFCAGADLSGPADERHHLVQMHEVNAACLALHRVRVPVVARVDGYAVGAGMNLALAADFVVASDRARFSQLFVKRGLSVDFAGSWLLPRLVGLHKSKELVLLGDMWEAAQLLELGILRQVVPADQLDLAVAELTDKILAGPPIAMAQSKRLLNDSFEAGLEVALEAEARAQVINGAMDDAAEAAQAFFEKRPPLFTGR